MSSRKESYVVSFRRVLLARRKRRLVSETALVNMLRGERRKPEAAPPKWLRLYDDVHVEEVQSYFRFRQTVHLYHRLCAPLTRPYHDLF